jgi:hypothetical protein
MYKTLIVWKPIYLGYEFTEIVPLVVSMVATIKQANRRGFS